METFKDMTKPLTERRMAFLQDVVATYNSANRSLVFSTCEEVHCLYSHSTNNIGCAIGKHLYENLCLELDKKYMNSVTQPKIFKRLPEWMLSLHPAFLGRCQTLHDVDLMWDEKGLSERGEERVA